MMFLNRSHRARLVRKLSELPHRISGVRRITMTFTLVSLYAIPISGAARVDLWGGNHRFLFAPAHWVEGLGAVCGGIASLYVLTFFLNWGGGRLFCGFGCPAGQLSRFADHEQALSKEAAPARSIRIASLQNIGFAALLSLGVLLWWVDEAVLWRAETPARLITLAVWATLTLAAWWHGRRWRWTFCRKWCPIGLYYSAVQLRRSFGIQFDPEACTYCELCRVSCPVNLEPTELDERIDGAGGLAIDGFPARHHCLSCGDCVRACELAGAKSNLGIALRLGFPDPPSQP